MQRLSILRWCRSRLASHAASVARARSSMLSERVEPLRSPWLCPPISLSLSEFTKSLSNVPRGVSFPLKCLSLFNNTLFVDQWPFSVALLQFGVYLSLILAIKSFAFETQTWRVLALSDWICVVFGCTTSSTSTEWAKRNPSRCPLLILDINDS